MLSVIVALIICIAVLLICLLGSVLSLALRVIAIVLLAGYLNKHKTKDAYYYLAIVAIVVLAISAIRIFLS